MGTSPGKRERMLEQVLEVFVAGGYVGTSTDQLAAAASVSKQTLYKEFGDKEGVFVALVRLACDRVEDPLAPLVARMRAVADAEEAVRMLAEQLTRAVMTPYVQQLRRLVIAEATRFPQLGLLYWEAGFQRVLNSVRHCLEVLDERGLLAVPDAATAARHLAGMLLWIPGNQAMFAPTVPVTSSELDRVVAAGSQAFLRAYRAGPPTSTTS